MPDLVSIIIPNYNHGQFLNQRIESVLSQTYKNFEVIILDDASEDNSIDIINSYAGHPKVSQVMLNTNNSGSVFSQWFKGIELAKGNYIWIAESDDYCEPDFLQNIMQVFVSDIEFGLVYTGSNAVDYSGKLLWNSPLSKSAERMDGLTFVQNKMVQENSIYNASMAVFNKKYITTDIEDIKSFKFCGDWLFWILIAQNCKVAYIGRLLNYFRNHEKDVSGKSYHSGIYFREYKLLLDQLLKRKIITLSKRRHSLFLMLPLVKEQISNLALKNEIISEYKLELNSWECLLWKLEIVVWNRIRHRINKYLDS